MSDTRYASGGPDGWLRVRREGSGDIVSLPEYLQVRLVESKDGRDYFTPMEGVYAGRRLSVKSGHLNKGRPEYRGAAHLRFELSREVLHYPGGEIRAITYDDGPIPLGTHPIQLPDFPHDKGRHYLGNSAYAMNWFYLGHGEAVDGRGDRYLHAGRASAGCVTVDPMAWTNLYRYLILCRSGDGKTVGTINVVR